MPFTPPNRLPTPLRVQGNATRDVIGGPQIPRRALCDDALFAVAQGASTPTSEAEHGPISDEEIPSVRDQLHRARNQRMRGGANAA
ncbi:hypothetical protein [Streptomyces sp. NPDC020965]|uniref:hypothetical protein n=1 Tax=Streptomyces sp. NPDC020965 TaxID=3365105 RepID=UPI0037B42439